MTSKFKPGVYLLRRDINRECMLCKELESKSDPSLEEIASLAELRSKLKGRLRTVEQLIKENITNPEISIILTLKLQICTTIETPQITHVLHTCDKPRVILKPQTQTKPKSQVNKVKTLYDSKSVLKPILNESIKKAQGSLNDSVKPKPRVTPTPTPKPKKDQTLRSSHTPQTSISQDQSTVITIKISKQDYYQLLQSKQSLQISRSQSNLLFD